MTWRECDAMSQRREFTALAMVEGVNMAELCHRFGVSRKTGYKWRDRARREGEEGLKDRSRRPKESPGKTGEEVEREVLAMRDLHPAWGGRKIRRRLLDLGRPAPAASTVTEILRRGGRLSVEESVKRQPLKRFERSRPNELWQMDFKGEFRMNDRNWCHPLTVLDDHSRFSLVLSACGDLLGDTVVDRLTTAFRRYGLPQAILTDNGTPWGVTQAPGGHTRLTVWLMDLDVKVLHGRPYHPQTQGKEERFHRTLKAEVIQGRQFDDLACAQRRFEPWREVYNHERPHEALGLAVPASRYQISSRAYPEHPSAFVYDSSFEVRKVGREGRVRFRGLDWYLGRAFRGLPVGIRPTPDDGVHSVHYRTFQVSTFNLRRPR